VHLKTTDLNLELALELPVGNSTDPANANEGTGFIPHRSKLAVPLRPGQVHLGDAANDITANYEWLHEHGAIAVFDYNGSSPLEMRQLIDSKRQHQKV